MSTVTFKLWVVVDLAGTTEETVFSSILPKAVDAVQEKIAATWNGGLHEGHRVWSVITSGQWGFSEENKSKRAYAEMTLSFKMLTNV